MKTPGRANRVIEGLRAEIVRLMAEIDRLQVGGCHRERLPMDRGGVVRKLKVGSAKVYLKTGEYPDGRLGEIFLQLDEFHPILGDKDPEKQIANLVEQVTDLSVSVSRLLDALATMISIGLQYQIPLEVFLDKIERTNFEPSGWTGDESIGRASSPLDAVARYLRLRYGTSVSMKKAVAE